ncbi:methyl-accepting chemotaxis protein [Candidatus Uabimicrobium amorphum]|uniref:Methyl-accepting chemotaxis protein n=1 Tax=Uabimicrobium amorphum TaxID=2596890 RepID=A0A5S9IKS8_UABAM|nr:methyl-accepting chemotaxis protein [Candidatus Uabimicrobium amorphum]BBM83182.1 methyl-accepting chemotaxis protein [Candidatus Uabimicrobium amorphum]
MRQFKKLLLMNAFIIGSVIAVTWMVVVQVADQQKQTALNSGEQIAKRYAQEISMFLEKNHVVVRGFAKFIEHNYKDDHENIKFVLEDFLRENTYLAAVFSCMEPFSKDKESTTYYWNRLGDKSVKFEERNDTHKNDWYRKSKVTKNFQVIPSAIYKSSPLVSFVFPVVKDDEFVGVVGIDIAFETFASIVENANAYDVGYAFLLDSESRYLVHPNVNLVEQGQTIQSYAKQHKNPDLEEVAGQTSGHINTIDPESGTNVYLFFESLMSNTWKIAVAIPENQIVNNDVARSAMLTCLIACIFIVIVTYIFAAESTISLHNVTDTVTSLSQGNLKNKVQIPVKGEVGKLGNVINKFVDNLHDFAEKSQSICDNLQKSVKKAHTEGDNIFVQAEKEASAVNQFRQKISATSKMLDETTATTNKVEKQVQSIKSTMDGLSRTSNKMSEVLKIIDDIAFETNLLAINAAIESAHVGDVGKGFEVVADEMRLLSKRTEMQSNEVSQSIHNNVQQINQGVEAINQMMENITEIASASEELAQTIKEISKSVVEMDAFTQHNLSLINELKITSNKINNDAQALTSLIQFFQTK